MICDNCKNNVNEICIKKSINGKYPLNVYNNNIPNFENRKSCMLFVSKFSPQYPEAYNFLLDHGFRETDNCSNCLFATKPKNIKDSYTWLCTKADRDNPPHVSNYEVCNLWKKRN